MLSGLSQISWFRFYGSDLSSARTVLIGRLGESVKPAVLKDLIVDLKCDELKKKKAGLEFRKMSPN